jgi:hypothetical protein
MGEAAHVSFSSFILSGANDLLRSARDRRYWRFSSGCPATCRLLVTLKTPGTVFA